jgi:tetratricopeptide (TPR) repeat protein
MIGAILLFAHRYDEAISELNGSIKMDPAFSAAHNWIAVAYAEQGKANEAIQESQEALSLSDNDPFLYAALGAVYAACGQTDKAYRILDDIKARLNNPTKPMAAPIAEIYAVLGNKDEAFMWLERAYDTREAQLSQINAEVFWDNLRSDPRFQVFLRRMGFGYAN